MSAVEKWLESVDPGWWLLGFGAAAIFGAVWAVCSGRIEANYRKWGWWVRADLERDVDPLQFAVRVLLQVLVGFALIFFGLNRLVFS